MSHSIIRQIVTAFVIFAPTFAFSAVPAWNIIPDKSTITFTATQNGSPITGQFKIFSGDINFDPKQLNASHVEIKINTASVTTSYGQVADTLKTSDWFNTGAFPQATFKADHFTKIGDHAYSADGTLTIRDKTVPVVLAFDLDTFTKTDAHATGSTVLKRTSFGVGQGDWAKTDEIKDDVNIKFELSAKAK